ncbi:MAG: 50S ribosomal protein L9 [Alphaproteobacteria bacterium]|nr:50S ribosomal protein L9 [Alphaproteobacteria bacterium]
MSTQVILLERVEKLGEMGEVVSVKPGYARNYLLPQKKALRASKENVAYFEAKKKHFEAENEKLKKEAEKFAKTLEGLKVTLVRQASEAGQLYGSVNARDIAEQIAAQSKQDVTRQMVHLNQNFKTIGLFPVDVVLHPEVKVEVIVNIARSAEEAKIQAETGKALVADAAAAVEDVAEVEADLEEVLEDSALEAEKDKAEKEAAKAEKEEAKKAKKQAAKAEADAEDSAEEEEASDEE